MSSAHAWQAPQCPGIIPPYMLRHIADHGRADQRAAAEQTLVLNAAVLARRATQSLEVAPPEKSTGTASVTIYDAAHATTLPGRVARTPDGPASGDLAVDEAYDGLRATLELLSEEFDRDSLDGRGLDLTASVHYGLNYNNAAWTGTQMIFGDGDAKLFNRFTIAVDVIGHELTHGMTQYTAGLDYQGQSGALNESVSDVFGTLVRQHQARQSAAEADWLIGVGLFTANVNGKALRSMTAPGTARRTPPISLGCPSGGAAPPARSPTWLPSWHPTWPASSPAPISQYPAGT